LPAGRLWLHAGSCGSWAGMLSVDPTTGISVSYGTRTFYCPMFTTSPTDPNLLLLGETGSPLTIYKYDVSNGSPTLLHEARDPGGSASNLRDMVVTPDGSKVLTSSGSPYHVQELRLSDLEPTGVTYGTGPYPRAVAVSDAGGASLQGVAMVPMMPISTCSALVSPSRLGRGISETRTPLSCSRVGSPSIRKRPACSRYRETATAR
jgi:hypothetical protein